MCRRTVDLTEIAGVGALKSPSRRLNVIGANASLPESLQRYGCLTPEELLESGLEEAFGKGWRRTDTARTLFDSNYEGALPRQ